MKHTHLPWTARIRAAMFVFETKNQFIMYFSNESDAVLALMSLVLSADKVGTTPEREYLFGRVRSLESFKDLSREAFSRRVAHVNELLFASPEDYDRLMQPEGIAKFCAALKSAIPQERLGPAFNMACEIACSDGLNIAEQRVLHLVGRNLCAHAA